jgi:hypothetical protein
MTSACNAVPSICRAPSRTIASSSAGTGVSLNDPRMTAALSELQIMIRDHFPQATFAVSLGDYPEGVYLTPTVDVPDTEAVFDVVIDRLLQLQIEDGLPVYVIPVQPLERSIKYGRTEGQFRSMGYRGESPHHRWCTARLRERRFARRSAACLATDG